jgi:hypothetical protein
VDDDRHVDGPEHVDQTREASGVVEVPVTADNGLELPRRQIETSHVLPTASGCHTGIEEEAVSAPALGDFDVRGEPRFGRGRIDHLATVQGEGLHRRGLTVTAEEAPRRALIEQPEVDDVVADRRDRDGVDWLEWDDLADPVLFERRPHNRHWMFVRPTAAHDDAP